MDAETKYSKGPGQRIGWLFVLATAAGVFSVALTAPVLGEEDVLAAVESNQSSLLWGQMAVFVMLAAMIGTAVLLFPILNKHSEQVALSYLLARLLEVVTILIGLVAGLLLLPLSWDVAESGQDVAGAEALAETLKAASDWTGYFGAQIVFSISALILNWAFLRHRLLPRWLAVWGLIGVPLMFASGFLVMVESLNDSATALNLLVLPLAVQEMAMAIWMIVNGLDVERPDKSTKPPTSIASWEADQGPIDQEHLDWADAVLDRQGVDR